MKLKSILFFASAMLVMSNSFGQYYAGTKGSKYVLVEEATGPGCGYCPEGAQDVEEGIAAVYPHAIIASWHGADYDASDMVVGTVGLPGYDPFCGGTPYIAGFPAATIDRTVFPDPGHYNIPAVGVNRCWESFVSTRLATTPNFDIITQSTYDPSTKKLTVVVTAYALSAQTGNWNINALIVEDSIPSSASDHNQHSYLTSQVTACDGKPNWFYGKGSIIPAASYAHMNVVRTILSAGGVFGDAAFTNPAKDAKFTKTYTYTINTAVTNPTYMKVIAMVQKPGPGDNSTVGKNTVENAIESRVRLMPVSAPVGALGVNGVGNNTVQEITLFPNPAKNRLTVNAFFNSLTPTETTVTIVNVTGQVVFNQTYPAGGTMFGENISLQNFSNGVYILSLSNSGETATKQFTVNK